MAKGQSLQDPFLNALRKERVPVSIYLVNGIKLQGQIDSFDQFVVLLKNSVSQMVYKHAISTVVPARNVRLSAEEGGRRPGDACRVMSPAHGKPECSSARGPVSARCWCAWGWAAQVDPEDLQEFDAAGASRPARMPGRDGHRAARASRFALLRRQRQGRGAAARSPHANDADVILVDHALSPSQERNLEKLIERRVLDRNGLILDIFAQRARSFEGKLRSGAGAAEAHRRAAWCAAGRTSSARRAASACAVPARRSSRPTGACIAQRVRVLTRRLAKIEQQRETGRQTRAEIPVPSLALVGYTNAGKSTLFRALTGADAYVADQLFATLDPTVRRITLPGGTAVVVADTVGFIRELPHELVAAFQSTLHRGARGDAAAARGRRERPAPRRAHRSRSMRCSREIGAQAIPQILVYNKIDRLELAPRIDRDADGRVTAVWISAATGAGLDLLRQAVAERLARFARRGAAAHAGRPPARCARACMPRRRCAPRPAAMTARWSWRWSCRTWSCCSWRAPRACRSSRCRGRTRLVRPRTPTYNRPPARARPSCAEFRAMAWNQPGSNNQWGRRPGQGGPDLDERLKSWQRRLESLLRPAGGRGGDGGPLLLIAVAVVAAGVAAERLLPGQAGRARHRPALRAADRGAAARHGAGAALADRDASPRSTSRASTRATSSRACSPPTSTSSSCTSPCSTSSATR